MSKLTIFLVCLLSFTNLGVAQINTVITPNEIKIGEQSELSFTVSSAKAVTILPLIADTLSKEIEIVVPLKPDTQLINADSVQVTFRYKITSFDEGYWPVRPLKILVNSDTLMSTAGLLTVVSIAIDSAQNIIDIKPIQSESLTFFDYLKIYQNEILVGLAVLIALALIYYLVKKLNKKPVIKEAPVTIRRPPHEIALEQLAALEAQKLWQNDKTKAYHSAISEILRTYIEGRFSLPALEQTTDEIMRGLRLVDISNEASGKIRNVLVLSDLVKFAKEKPLPTENETALQMAISFVELTKQVSISEINKSEEN